MTKLIIKFPVICPECGHAVMCELPVKAVAAALIYQKPLTLKAKCHARSWTANGGEIEKIREYLAAI
jgi:hypothetical protein